MATMTRTDFIRECNRRRDLGLSLSGNTYPIREEIKLAGGIWDSKRECWLMPDRDSLARMAALMGSAPPPAPRARARGRKPWTREQGPPCPRCNRPQAASMYRSGDWYCPDSTCRRQQKETPPPAPVAAREIQAAAARLPAYSREPVEVVRPVGPQGKCWECGEAGPEGHACTICREGNYV